LNNELPHILSGNVKETTQIAQPDKIGTHFNQPGVRDRRSNFTYCGRNCLQRSWRLTREIESNEARLTHTNNSIIATSLKKSVKIFHCGFLIRQLKL
jgi:hypothetical protein